jgi:hypothetical protein
MFPGSHLISPTFNLIGDLHRVCQQGSLALAFLKPAQMSASKQTPLLQSVDEDLQQTIQHLQLYPVV